MTRLVFLITVVMCGPNRVQAEPSFDLEVRKQRLPWIWKAPAPQVVPQLNSPAPATDVDRFILSRLRAAGIQAAPPADDLTWLRRVSFALTGLPPDREQGQSLLADPSEGRRERVVDALLASPHFGERWARHWMDLMRYAESRGHEEDFAIANAWRYRDYLVRALNADVTYDRFVAEHIAGDLIAPRIDPATGSNESVLATGWAFLGEENHSPVDIRLDECERIDNKIDVLSKSFLGLTVACARCHDHKFDAITQADYYALAGFVTGSPYRQVRFETMESHARASADLEVWRTGAARAIGMAVAASARPGAATLAATLHSARCQLRGEPPVPAASTTGLVPARLQAWCLQLTQAAADPNHALHTVGRLAATPTTAETTTPVSDAPEDATSAPALPDGAIIIADFTRPGQTPWKVDGPTFGSRPMRAGEMRVGTPDRPLARLLTAGAAVRDPFWNRLALAAGTEVDSGSLAAATRAGKTLLTPKVTLKTGRLHYLIRGRATVYAGVDSHLMIAGPLHGKLVASFETGERAAWVTHDLSAYAGHRAHLEFSPQGDAALEIFMAVDAPEPPVWQPDNPWQPATPAATWQQLADTLQHDVLEALDILGTGAGAIPSRSVALVNWLLQHPELTGASEQVVRDAAAPFFRRRADLASTLRWDSATAASWGDGTGVDERVQLRGKPTSLGPVVPRGLPAAFGQPRVTDAESSGRAQLAGQMTDPGNPLVARVFVNRVWHHLFGRGLVATVDNFGVLGERPTHPELLDHLAWHFVHEDRWSLKRLLRRLVLTEAYARGSRAADDRAEALDPENRLLHRMPIRRLEGEAIRDALLLVSGRLDRTQGGPPVPLHLTEFTVGRGSPQTSGPLDGAGRRSLYIASRRNFLPTLMLAFDLPTPFSTVGRRNVTNVPAQSLALMNDPMIREQASVWAARLLHELPDADAPARISWLFESAFGRPPTTAESAATLESLHELHSLHAGTAEEGVWSELCHALVGTNDFIHLK